jgi:glycosyltransferase involved in cell wall biosynthesis
MTPIPTLIPARKFRPAGLRGAIWRGLRKVAPHAARRYFDRMIRRAVARQGRGPGGVPVSLIGVFALPIGLGRAAHLLGEALAAVGVPVQLTDCTHCLRKDVAAPAQRPAFPAAGTLVFCINPPEIRGVLGNFGPHICAGKRLVGYWWWELDQVPRRWLPWARLVDEIWVSSRYVQETFARTLPGKPVRYVPLPVPEPAPSALARPDFGLAAQRFTVLVAFDLSSGWARKNPEGAIAAFRRAFPGAGAAQLVLKVGGAARHPAQLARLRGLTAAMPNVHIIDRTLPHEDLAALLRCADVLLSLHRAEGFGLFIAEAMWLGTPIVATGWSGVMDMLDSENALLVRFATVPVRPGDYPEAPRGASWAEPDLDHAAECLRRLASDPALGRALSARARQRAEAQFSVERFRALAPSLLQPPA